MLGLGFQRCRRALNVVSTEPARGAMKTSGAHVAPDVKDFPKLPISHHQHERQNPLVSRVCSSRAMPMLCIEGAQFGVAQSLGEGWNMDSQETSLDALLESLVTSLHYVPIGARKVSSGEELPLRLRARIVEPHRGSWKAWLYGEHVWFVCARRISGDRESKVLVEFFDIDGRSVCKGIWVRDRLLRWALALPVAGGIETRAAP